MENNRWFWARKDCTQYWRASRPPIQRLEAKHWSVGAPRSNQAAISGTLSVEVIPCQVLGVGICLDQTRSFKQGSKPIEDKRLVLTCFGYIFEKAKPVRLSGWKLHKSQQTLDESLQWNDRLWRSVVMISNYWSPRNDGPMVLPKATL